MLICRFHSDHGAAHLHATARAISGACPHGTRPCKHVLSCLAAASMAMNGSGMPMPLFMPACFIHTPTRWHGLHL